MALENILMSIARVNKNYSLNSRPQNYYYCVSPTCNECPCPLSEVNSLRFVKRVLCPPFSWEWFRNCILLQYVNENRFLLAQYSQAHSTILCGKLVLSLKDNRTYNEGLAEPLYAPYKKPNRKRHERRRKQRKWC